LLISIDSHAMTEHERNRGLKGVGERIREGIRQAHRAQIPVIASVTVNRLVDYDALPVMLGDLGFDAVAFSYPRRLPFGSSSLVYSEESELLNFESGELVSALDAIKKMKRHFPVLNPTASITDIQNHIQGKDEAFSCVGGYKYFYIDWNLDIWRCEAWSTKLGSVFDFEQMAEDRSHCTNCSMSCYRDTSVMMHAAISMADALSAIASGRIGGAAKLLFRRSVALSALSMIAEAKTLVRLRDKVESPN
ncbi:MAG: radical SAM protein, partial [Dongiaceae bacterium]